MIWAKREFQHAGFGPYQERLEKLLMKNPDRASEFIMVSTSSDHLTTATYFVGLPEREFLLKRNAFRLVHSPSF